MPESPETRSFAKLIATVCFGYFTLLTLCGTVLLLTGGRYAFGGKAVQLMALGVYIWVLQFYILSFGVMRDQREHENLLPKALVSLFLGGGASVFLVKIMFF